MISKPLCRYLTGFFLFILMNTALNAQNTNEDPWLWLEEVTAERSLDWARARNAESQAVLEADPAFAEHRDRLLTILDSDARIPAISKAGDWFYNFWRDEEHPRGLGRRTTLQEYLRSEPAWETVLDLDQLSVT